MLKTLYKQILSEAFERGEIDFRRTSSSAIGTLIAYVGGWRDPRWYLALLKYRAGQTSDPSIFHYAQILDLEVDTISEIEFIEDSDLTDRQKLDKIIEVLKVAERQLT